MKTLSLLFLAVFTSVCVADEPNTGRYSGTIKVTFTRTISSAYPDIISSKVVKIPKATLIPNGTVEGGYGLYFLTQPGEPLYQGDPEEGYCFYLLTPSAPMVSERFTTKSIRFTQTRQAIMWGNEGTITFEGVFHWRARP